MKDVFLIVDGNSLMHRAYHALPPMDYEGKHTNAIHGFLSMVLRLASEEKAQYLAVCFDEHGKTFRHLSFPEYKAGRRETDPELREQFETIRLLLTEMGIRWYALEGWEADDLLGTLSRLGAEAGVTPLLVTGDRDALQLVGGGTELIYTRRGISDTTRYTPSVVYEEYGFTPEQVPDWKGLAGDSSDNIPGIPGIGDKTAVGLLQKYGSLEEILKHADEEKGKKGERLRDGRETARKCRDLATIRRDAPVAWRLADCAVPRWEIGIGALQRLGLQQVARMIRSMSGQDSSAPMEQGTAEAEETAPELLPFRESVAAESTGDVERFLQGLGEDSRPLAVYLTDTHLSLAAVDGQRLEMELVLDMLHMDLDMDALFRLLGHDMREHPAVVHDCKRFCHFLEKNGAEIPERFEWDVMLGAYLLNPQEKSYALRSLLKELPENAAGLLSLKAWQQARLEALDMLHLMRDVEMPLAMVLERMESIGCRVDGEHLRMLGLRYTEEIHRTRDAVYEACGAGPFNLNSTQQLGHVLFEVLKLPHGKKTTKGYSTAVEVLEDLRSKAPEVIEPLLRYRQMTKLNGTYIEGLIPLLDPESRVHSYFDQTGTATGRISSADPNLQNIPVRTPEGKEIREAFIPREGWVMLDADYSQIELRLMAHFSGDEAMLDAFRKGQDVHARTASEIFDVPMEAVTPVLRSRAKAVNFGLIYGISKYGLARNTGVSEEEAGDFMNRYFMRYPGVRRYMSTSVANAMNQGCARTLMGRRRALPELKSSNRQTLEFGRRVAMNMPVQGTAADIIKLAMVRVDAELRKAGMRSRLILQVHDELILECPPEEAEQASRILRTCMEGVMELKVPLVAEVHQGLSWAEAK